MPRGAGCNACMHRSRKAVDRMLLQHIPLRVVGLKFDLSPSVLARHKKHLDEALCRDIKTAETRALRGVVDELVAEIETLDRDVRHTKASAKKMGQGQLVLKAVREARENILAKARLTGQLASDRPSRQELHLHLPADRAAQVAKAFLSRHPQLEGIPGAGEPTVEAGGGDQLSACDSNPKDQEPEPDAPEPEHD